MPKLEAPYNNANAKVKKMLARYSNANAKVKKLYKSNGTAWVKIFSGAVTWTYTASVVGTFTYARAGASHAMEAQTTDISGHPSRSITVTYTFPEPVHLPANSALVFHSTPVLGYSVAARNLAVNGTSVYAEAGTSLPNDLTTTINLASATDVTTIEIYEQTDTGPLTFSVDVTLNPTDRDSFSLNNTGTSN